MILNSLLKKSLAPNRPYYVFTLPPPFHSTLKHKSPTTLSSHFQFKLNEKTQIVVQAPITILRDFHSDSLFKFIFILLVNHSYLLKKSKLDKILS